MISKIILYLKVLISTKISFKQLKKKEVLFFDKSHSEILVDRFKLKSFEVLPTRFEEFNFWVLLSMFLNLKFDINEYYKIYILKTSPKIVITLIDNVINFYKLKQKFPNIIFISIQNGLRKAGYNDIFKNEIFLNSKKLSCDYFFVFNKYIAEKYFNYIEAKYIILGAFKNNFIPFKTTQTKNDFLFISQYRKNNFLEKVNYERKFLQLLKKYFKNNKSKISILLASKSKENQRYEISFYKNYFGSNCTFIKNKFWWDPYTVIDNYENIIFIDSTLGYEAISRKKKVAIFSLRKSKNIIEYFGWPSNVKNRNISFFCGHKLDYKEVKRVLTNIKFCSNEKWKSNFLPFIRDQLYFNKNNLLLKNKIELILKQ